MAYSSGLQWPKIDKTKGVWGSLGMGPSADRFQPQQAASATPFSGNMQGGSYVDNLYNGAQDRMAYLGQNYQRPGAIPAIPQVQPINASDLAIPSQMQGLPQAPAQSQLNYGQSQTRTNPNVPIAASNAYAPVSSPDMSSFGPAEGMPSVDQELSMSGSMSNWGSNTSTDGFAPDLNNGGMTNGGMTQTALGSGGGGMFGDMSWGDIGNTALQAAQGVSALMQGWGAYKDGKRSDKIFKEGQKQFAANYNNQVKSNNTYMEDRQRIRHSDSGGKAQEVAAYMDTNRLERYS